MNKFLIVGSPENSMDISRFLAAYLKNRGNVAVVDLSKHSILCQSVFGYDFRDENLYEGIYYTTNESYVEKWLDSKEIVIIYVDIYNASLLLESNLLNSIDKIIFCYGPGRFAFDCAYEVGKCISRSGKSCIVIYRKKNQDKTADVLTHTMLVEQLFMIPKNDIDDSLLEEIDYGLTELMGLSFGMKQFLDYVGQRLCGLSYI